MIKLVGGHSKVFYILISVFLLYCKTIDSFQIYDYETEKFIEKINYEILSVNNYSKKIKLRIINDNFPNAFVVEENTIFLSAGLLIYSPDYVSLLAVLAHEIGHLEKNHIIKRKKEINNLKRIGSLSNLVAIAGSMIIQDPQLINAVVVNQTTINNLYINFTQDQEREADLYAVETLNKLKLSTDSVKEFLIILENQTKFDLLDEEFKKFSTHPLFKERYKILDSNKNIDFVNYDKNLNKEFNFIKAKFMAYTNTNSISNLKGDEEIYYNAIKSSLSGNLLESLKNLNLLISKYDNNFFLIESKADILLSYGYTKEAINFYKKVLNKYPDNHNVKYNIFINFKHNNKKKEIIKDIFEENIKLISLFPNNQALLSKFYDLSKILENEDWEIFFELLLFKENDLKNNLISLQKQTKDINLKKIIKIYI